MKTKDETYTLRIFQDNVLRKEFNNQKSDFEAFKYVLNHQGNSINHAIKYEGWKVEIENEQTKEISYYETI